MEVVEEEIGLFLNAIKDKQLQFQKPEYQGEEFNLENITSTAINTMISSVGLGVFQAYTERNGILQSSKFQVAENPDFYLDRLEKDFANKTFTETQYQAAKEKIKELSDIYTTNKPSFENLNDNDQISLLSLHEESIQLSKEIPTLTEKKLEKAASKLESVS